MNNPLNAPVQIINFPPLLVVWYSPVGFPDLETCADLISITTDEIVVFKGYEYETITHEQVDRIVTARSVERAEQIAIEWEEYDAQTKS